MPILGLMKELYVLLDLFEDAIYFCTALFPTDFFYNQFKKVIKL